MMADSTPVHRLAKRTHPSRQWLGPLLHGIRSGKAASGLVAVLSLAALSPAYAQQGGPGSTVKPAAPISNSALDDRLMYQLLVAEMALAQGDTSTAYDWMLDAARRTRDEGLFRRSTDVALQARAGEQALAATKAWRLARPESVEALRTQLQILLVMQRTDSLAEPLRLLLAQTPADERSGLIAALPRFLHRAGDPGLVAALMEDALKPYRAAAPTRVQSAVALGRAWLEARDTQRAWALAQEAFAADQPAQSAAAPALLALELMTTVPQSEALVKNYLGSASAEPGVRLAYARALVGAQRFTEAVAQLESATAQQPGEAAAYLTLGALQLELKHPQEAQAALLRYVSLVSQRSAAPPAGANSGQNAAAETEAEGSDDDDDDGLQRPDRGLVQAWLMLAQASEQLGDFKAAEAWLARIEDPASALEVQTRRATMLVRQGQLELALQAIRVLPETRPEQARAKLLAEVSVLREGQRWTDAYALLGSTQQRFGEDPDLLYEQSMMAEKVGRFDDMEQLLKRVIEIKPANAHAYNALGYSLAERKVRLPEARALILRALELSPGDPFITDSLGWVEYRLGNLDEALRLLRLAWQARPDTEIGAHLGEVLWARGLQDEARRIWREAQARDKGNDVLREALTRLRVDL
jgi:tetratricopeptide (TPR) repeat protein